MPELRYTKPPPQPHHYLTAPPGKQIKKLDVDLSDLTSHGKNVSVQANWKHKYSMPQHWLDPDALPWLSQAKNFTQ